jgi:hypothetical protein
MWLPLVEYRRNTEEVGIVVVANLPIDFKPRSVLTLMRRITLFANVDFIRAMVESGALGATPGCIVNNKRRGGLILPADRRQSSLAAHTDNPSRNRRFDPRESAMFSLLFRPYK